MKKILLLLIALSAFTLSAGATKIYVCGEKITGTKNFSAGGGAVRLLTATKMAMASSPAPMSLLCITCCWELINHKHYFC